MSSSIPVPPLLPGDLEVSAFQVTRPKVIKDTVTQLDDGFTPVTLNAAAGIITLYPSFLAPDDALTFTVFNSYVGVGAIVLAGIQGYDSGGGSPSIIVVNIVEGAFDVTMRNDGVIDLDGTITVSFLVV